jgi:hypothetical protein
MRHGDVPAGFIHTPFNWVYANAAARVAATGFVAGDVNKLALDLDTGKTWRVVSVAAGAATWAIVGGTVGTLDTIAAPVADVSMNAHKLTGLADATASTDALNRETGDGRYVLSGSGTIKDARLPSSAQRSLWLGLNSNSLSGYGATDFWPQRGVVYDRLEFTQPAAIASANSTSGVTLATSIGLGMIPVILIEPSTYGSGAIPAGANITTFANYVVAQIQAVEAAFPDKGILYEIINEPWTTGNFSPIPTAANHADVIKGVWDACIAAGLDMTRIYVQAQHATWVTNMYAQQSTLKTEVQGWAVHPYGSPPPGYASSTGQGIASVTEFRNAIFSGANNILISEIGVRDWSVAAVGSFADESGAMTAADAYRWARQILQAARGYHEAGWLKACLWYNRNSSPWQTNVVTTGALTNVGLALAESAQPIKSVKVGDYSTADDNYLAQSILPEAARDNIALTSGKIYVARIRIDERAFAQNIYAHVNVAGATLTAGQCLAGIYDQLGNQWDVTSNQATAWASTGRKSMGGFGDNYKPGIYYLALLAVGTTMPQFAGAIANPIADGNGAVAPNRFMQASAAGSTSLPATLTLSSMVPTSSGIWLAIGV